MAMTWQVFVHVLAKSDDSLDWKAEWMHQNMERLNPKIKCLLVPVVPKSHTCRRDLQVLC